MDRTGTQTQARSDTHFGALLRRYRRRAGLTQEQLAERALLSDRAIGDLERQAARLPRLETATLLADALALQGAERDTFLAVARGETPSAIVLPPLTGAAASPPAPTSVAPIAPTVFPGILTTLVGREHEEAAIAHLLGEARLLTLTGPGGVGKTRLALRAAETLRTMFPDGVVVVPLAAVRAPEHVLPAIAQALGLTDEGARGAAAVLYAHLRHRRMLLVLDNVEQVAEVAPELVSLLLACPDVRALVTSRVALRVQGEQELAVRPLAVPAPALSLAAVRQSPAVQLFEQRARAVHPDFTLTETTAGIVAEICRRLDGLPLALELAAARLKLLPPAALLAHLERGLGALSTLGVGGPDRPDRHRTLRATIAWSYDLLGPSEQALFRRLAVFAGGWTLEAAEAINPAAEVLEGLAALVDHSLIYLADTPASPHAEAHMTEACYGMLETVRAYGLEQLEQNGEAEATQRAHAEYLVAMAEQAEAALHGPDQRAWLARLQRDHDNVRVVLSWARDRGEAELGLRLAAALQRYWELHGHLHEAMDWLGALLPLAGTESMSDAVRAKGLRAGGVVAYRLADYARATSWLEQSLALYRDVGDQRGVANVLSNLGNVALATGDSARAARCYDESVALNRALGSPVGLASALNNLAEARRQQGQDDEAQALYEQSLALYQEVDDTWSIASVLNNLGGVALDRGDYATAEALYERSLALRQKLGNEPGIALVLGNLARASLLQGQGQRALALYTQGLEIHRRMDAKVGIAQCLEGLAEVACAQGEFTHVITLCGAAAALRSAINAPLPSPSQAVRDGILATAREHLGDERFYQAEAAGRAAPLERLIAEALAKTRATAEHPVAG